MGDNSESDTATTVYAVDLFCGGGGTSTGLKQACDSLGYDLVLVPVNHWETAIETHRLNHPFADHYRAGVEELHPPDVINIPDDDENAIVVLVGSPECTHFSCARGGKPVNYQKRASPWHVVDWLEKLDVDTFLVENVPDLKSWGPVDDDGQPVRDGSIFGVWVDALHALGYSVHWEVLNCADYGDATSRKRLFITGSREYRADFPKPTHAQNPGADQLPWRTAAEIIDWADRGESVWTRDITDGRRKPLKNTTMQRIAEGIRQHGSEDVQVFADALDDIGRDDVYRMRETAVSYEDAAAAAGERTEPFLVERPPVNTCENERELALATPYVMGQQSGAKPKPVGDNPLPTVATAGSISFIESEAFVLPRNGSFRGLHSNAAYDPDSRPLHTVTAKNHDGHLVTPFLVEYYGQGDQQPIDEPLPTVTTKDRFALVVPEAFPWGFDVKYRMLKPRELARAQGFPDDYVFAGNKTETTEQIGNAVPVNTARELCTHILTPGEPGLHSFTDEPFAEHLAAAESDD